MALPSEVTERAVATSASHTLLRVLTCILSFGYVRGIEVALSWMVYFFVDPGPAPAVPWMDTLETGSSWIVPVVAIAFMGTLVRAGLFAHAVIARGRTLAYPVVALVIGIGGLVFELGTLLSSTLFLPLATRSMGLSQVAAVSIVGAVGHQIGYAIDLVVRLTLFAVVCALALRDQRVAPSDGPYREASA